MTDAKITVTKVTHEKALEIKKRIGYMRIWTLPDGVQLSRGLRKNTLIYLIVDYSVFKETLIVVHNYGHFGDFNVVDFKLEKFFLNKTTREEFQKITDLEILYALL